MSDIFREIEDELRRDNYFKLWQRYGKYVIALVVVIVVAAALVVGWRQYELHMRQAEGVRFAAALDLATHGKDKDAAGAFAAVAHTTSGGRAALARFEEAALDTKTGDSAAAAAIYDRIATDGSLAQIYRDLATVMSARFLLEKDPKDVITRLKPLTDTANPWHPTALELTALAELKDGDRTEAIKTYQRLADDLTAPQGARARAAEIIAALGP